MFNCLKPIDTRSVKLKKREITKLLKVARSQVSISGLTSSHKYKVVKNTIKILEEQNIPIPQDIKDELTLAAKAFLKDVLDVKTSDHDYIAPNPISIVTINTSPKNINARNNFLRLQLAFDLDMA